jgi:hypothetical protein
MASFRRKALAVGIAASVLLAFAGPNHAQAPGALRLVLTDPPGGLLIVNGGTAPVAIQMAIVVQKQEIAGWVPVATEFNAVARCDAPGSNMTVEVAPATTLTVRPWRGFSCSGQCNYVCRANVYYGPGVFRFVVTAVPGLNQITSSAFALPAEPLR